ncbi:MAG TPA: cytochrome c biogenesis protein CcsA [Acidimicrobiales bacterium]|nr:cytochrome c biogenesis protein CcsA [Acidimicrobiales bacterium]
MSALVDRVLGWTALGLVALTVWLGLWVTPPDELQGDIVRLLYLHPALAWVALYLAFGLAALCSALYLWPRTRAAKWDLLAASTVEVGVVFLSLTLVTGMLWGRPAWGVWWTWDARLTSTALLELLFIGYLALRRVPADPHTRARRCAVLALLACLDVPIVHFSVQWWNGLHQGASVLRAGFHFTIHGSMLWTLLLSFVAFTCVFAWMVRRRYQLAARDAALEDTELHAALVERRKEGVR